ncbi:DUF3489 domain-containing protein [Tepidamorphus sp. 3E244]|uniref:DUF3489 domain-containing protein n=1 Tax=Tepidamorphus sp. 3E244 TaxID=3385498 RepID=UPI0038FC18A2
MTSTKTDRTKSKGTRTGKPAKPRATRRASGATSATGKSGTGEPRVTRLETILSLLTRPEGASIAELVEATGWQAHSVRGAIAGSLKKKGHAVSSQKVDGVRRYTVEGEGGAK